MYTYLWSTIKQSATKQGMPEISDKAEYMWQK